MSTSRSAAGILTFLIADVRGYTAFTQSRGDEAAAILAAKFAEIAREGVEAHGGEVIELRGDEALAIFVSAREALRAAVDLQLVFADEFELDPSLPLRVGIGIDAGEAVPVDGGYRGGALNLAARLCSQARAGEVLASQGVTHLARALDGVDLHEYGEVELKGLAEPVRAFRVAPTGIDPDTLALRFEPDGPAPAVARRTELPPGLDSITPIVGRDLDVRRLRWAWRLARRGEGAVVTVTGPTGIGKTRLAAEGAQTAAENGASVAYVSFAATAEPTKAAAAALSGGWPAYVVLDDLESADPTELESTLSRVESVDRSHGLVLLVFDDERASPELVSAARRLAGRRRPAAASTRPGRHPPDRRALPGGRGRRAAGGLARVERRRAAPRPRAGRRVGSLRGCEAAGRVRLAGGGGTQRPALRRGRSRRAASSTSSSSREQARLFGAGPGRGGRRAEEPPYKGLASFGVEDAEWFYGRERLVAELIARLAGAPLLGVVGPSGSGKSSAVRAGLSRRCPAGVLPDSDDWIALLMRPGEHPLRELDRALWAPCPRSVGPDRGPGPPVAGGARRARRGGTPRARDRPVRGGVHALLQTRRRAQRSSPR